MFRIIKRILGIEQYELTIQDQRNEIARLIKERDEAKLMADERGKLLDKVGSVSIVPALNDFKKAIEGMNESFETVQENIEIDLKRLSFSTNATQELIEKYNKEMEKEHKNIDRNFEMIKSVLNTNSEVVKDTYNATTILRASVAKKISDENKKVMDYLNESAESFGSRFDIVFDEAKVINSSIKLILLSMKQK